MKTLHLQQASMSWRDSDAEAREDYNTIFSRNAHAIGFTEVYGDLDLLRAGAKKCGYRVIWGPTAAGFAETVLAIRRDLEVLESGSILVNPAEKGHAPESGHSARHATWATIDFEGDEVTLVEGHWVTMGDPAHRESRAAKRRKMSGVFNQLAAQHGKGRSLMFGMGDTNEDDNPNDDGSDVYEPLEGKLSTIFDELREWPPTHRGRHHSTIDIIFSYDKDSRVEAHDVQIHRGGNSDHFQVSGFYNIEERALRH